ncbi:hypothetical protein ACFE04_019826 [Oxalis oulophora]
MLVYLESNLSPWISVFIDNVSMDVREVFIPECYTLKLENRFSESPKIEFKKFYGIECDREAGYPVECHNRRYPIRGVSPPFLKRTNNLRANCSEAGPNTRSPMDEISSTIVKPVKKVGSHLDADTETGFGVQSVVA